MEYVLSLWLVFAGESHIGSVKVVQPQACATVAQVMAEKAGAQLVAFSCVLEIAA